MKMIKMTKSGDQMAVSDENGPTSADQTPTSADQIPTSADQIPTSADQIHTSVDQIPTSADQTRTPDDQLSSSGEKTHLSHEQLHSSGVQMISSVDECTSAELDPLVSRSADDGIPYKVCGVQYLPKGQRSDRLKRTWTRMSTKRHVSTVRKSSTMTFMSTENRITVFNSLPAKVQSQSDGNLQSHLQTQATLSSCSDSDVKSDNAVTSAADVTDDVPVEFSLFDDSDVCTDSNRNELTHVDNQSSFRYPFENLVLSGGGSKGYAYIGALKALEDAGILSQIHRVGGSSAGAICGGLLAVGCSAQEIAETFFCDIKWLFQDQKCTCCFCLPKIWKNFGINPGLRFMEIYGEHIAKKVKNPDITFLELYRDYGREFCVVVTNLTRMCSEYCHWTTTPNLPIRQAVRISMAFPVMYEPVKCNLFGQENLYMDGGTLDQYPVHCFDGPLSELNKDLKTGQKRTMNKKTLGLYVVAEDPIDYKIWSTFFGQDLPYRPPYLPNTKLARLRLKEEMKRRKRSDKSFDPKKYISELKTDPVIIKNKTMMHHYTLNNKMEIEITSFGLYCKASLSTVIVNQRRLHVKPEDINRTVAINCGYVGTNDYDLEPADREFLIRCGYEHTKRFLQEHQKSATSNSATSQVKRDLSLPVMSQHSPDGSRLPRSISTSYGTSKETQV